MSSIASKRKPKKLRTTTSKKPQPGIKRSSTALAKKKTASRKVPKSVFEQLGFSHEESLVAILKVDLLAEILEIYRAKNYTKGEVARIWGKPHSRVSEVLSGKLHLVSVETLIGLLEKLGAVVKVSVEMKEAG